jgi:hypothetical protein
MINEAEWSVESHLTFCCGTVKPYGAVVQC